MIGTLSAPARLLRGFATDFLTSHDEAEVERIMDPAYCLNIGGVRFDGRDGSYLPATAAQLDLFPGLVVTVHDVMLGPDAVAMRFTEHGGSIRNPGRAAAWGGVTLFRIENGRLREGWAEEDYFARKRQLKTGVVDAICPPHPFPWDAPCLPPDTATETTVRAWLEDPHAMLSGEVHQVVIGGPRFAELIAPTGVAISTLFTAGPRAACHVELSGSYAGGFEDIDRALVGEPIVLRMAGLIDARNGAVTIAQVSADRLGLHRQLLNRVRA